MNVIVLTSSENNSAETARLIELFENGLETLHVRKPKQSTAEIEELITAIPKRFRGRIVLHGHYRLALKHKLKGVHLIRRHRSNSLKNRWRRFWLKLRHPGMIITATFHNIQSLTDNTVAYDYVFLGQLFTSNSMFNSGDVAGTALLKKVIDKSRTPVYALGGITNDKLERIQAAGFHGVGLSSAVLKTDREQCMSSYMRFVAA